MGRAGIGINVTAEPDLRRVTTFVRPGLIKSKIGFYFESAPLRPFMEKHALSAFFPKYTRLSLNISYRSRRSEVWP